MALPKMCLDADIPPSPCPRECPDRSAVCHAECAIYKQYFEECRLRREEKMVSKSLDSQRCDAIRKQKKRNHQHERH